MTGATVLAVSDLLVMTALERAGSRVAPRSQRAGVDRYRVHERYAIPVSRIDYALGVAPGSVGAWSLCPLLHSRHRLPVDLEQWTAMLDGYTRALLLMGQPHTTSRLAEAVARLLPEVAPSRGLHAVN